MPVNCTGEFSTPVYDDAMADGGGLMFNVSPISTPSPPEPSLLPGAALTRNVTLEGDLKRHGIDVSNGGFFNVPGILEGIEG